MGVLNQQVETVEHEETFHGTVSEMGAAEIASDIRIDPVRLEKIKARDNDPKFLVVEIEETPHGNGTSKAEWPGSIIRSIAEQVNKKRPVGYRGHIPDDQDKTSFPPVQAVWLAATVVERGNKTIARVKGYLMPNAEMRDYVELEAVDGVSVRGDATMSRKKGGGWSIKNFNLESIDFSRKGRAGMPTRLVAVTAEESRGGNSVEPKDIAALDEDELRAHGPLLVKEIERKATEPLQMKVSEMETAIDASQPKVDAFDEICKKLGIDGDESPMDKIVSLMDQVEGAAKERINTMVDAAVKKVAGKSERAQALVKRLVGEEIVEEFEGKENVKEDEIEKRISEMVEADEDVKAVVSEMTDDRESRGGANLGGKSRQVDPDDTRSRTGKVNFGKKKL